MLIRIRRFGPEERVTKYNELVQNFHRAVAEVYTLKEAGLNMDLASYPHKGSYAGFDFSDIKITASRSQEIVLSYPSPEAKAQLLELMQKGTQSEPVQETEFLVDEADAVVNESEPVKKEPDAPGSKRAALVKQDDSKIFDFMSNRPVPRAKPVEAATPAEQPKKDLEEEAEAQKLEQNIAVSREVLRSIIEKDASASITVIEPKVKPVDIQSFKHVRIPDNDVKFAVSLLFPTSNTLCHTNQPSSSTSASSSSPANAFLTLPSTPPAHSQTFSPPSSIPPKLNTVSRPILPSPSPASSARCLMSAFSRSP